MDCALALAFDSAGKSIPARIAIMAMTTNSSINVNALWIASTLEIFPFISDFSTFIGFELNSPERKKSFKESEKVFSSKITPVGG